MRYEVLPKYEASEIGSYIMLFLEDHVRIGVNELFFFSDNCPGQSIFLRCTIMLLKNIQQ